MSYTIGMKEIFFKCINNKLKEKKDNEKGKGEER